MWANDVCTNARTTFATIGAYAGSGPGSGRTACGQPVNVPAGTPRGAARAAAHAAATSTNTTTAQITDPRTRLFLGTAAVSLQANEKPGATFLQALAPADRIASAMAARLSSSRYMNGSSATSSTRKISLITASYMSRSATSSLRSKSRSLARSWDTQ